MIMGLPSHHAIKLITMNTKRGLLRDPIFSISSSRLHPDVSSAISSAPTWFMVLEQPGSVVCYLSGEHAG